MMTYQELQTKLQTQQTQIDNLLNVVERQQSLIDQVYVITTNIQLTITDLLNDTRANGSYIAGQISMKDGR